QIEGEYEGDAYFPNFDRSEFIEISRESHVPDENNQHTYHFIILERN
ncbi:MAG TPA: dihydrofolate reductase, partial [Gammaproteobacteria bacterium]|nr:dihydrofolate reductase [Gammaproteobacteria bacterium]